MEDLLLDRSNQAIAGHRQGPADDHQRGVEEVHDCGQTHADVPSGADDVVNGRQVAGLGRLDDVCDPERAPPLHQLGKVRAPLAFLDVGGGASDERASTGDRLQTSPLSAEARDAGIVHDPHMADIAGAAWLPRWSRP